MVLDDALTFHLDLVRRMPAAIVLGDDGDSR
jgi:hypothetical protein